MLVRSVTHGESAPETVSEPEAGSRLRSTMLFVADEPTTISSLRALATMNCGPPSPTPLAQPGCAGCVPSPATQLDSVSQPVAGSRSNPITASAS